MTVSRLVLSCAIITTAALAAPMRARAPAQKPPPGVVEPGRSDSIIVLKFHEGARLRVKSGQLSFDAARLTEYDEALLARVKLTPADVEVDVKEANARVASYKDALLYALSSRDPDSLDKERAELEARESEELADLNLYSMVVRAKGDASSTQKLIDQLNALASVEIAYAEPLPAVPAAVDIAPTTFLSLVPFQQYARDATAGGIDSDWAARLPGGLGDGVRVIDVENGWQLDHEDLPDLFAFDGVNFNYFDHGVAVLGVLGAGANGYGTTGLVPNAPLGASSVVFPRFWAPFSVALAIENAMAHLGRGDVIVVEQHYPEATPPGVTCACNCAQFGYLPAEGVQATFDMIRNATARGIIVVEAAGNGSMNLDSTFYNQRFQRFFRDSQAIIVGASDTAAAFSPACWTNSGSRVDLNGWGGSVTTLGYGDPGMRINGNDARQFYTMGFSGTSSATPIVTAAVVAVNGSRRADGLAPFDPSSMRQWLAASGVPQSSVALQRIGARPNLRGALPAVVGDLEDVSATGVASGFAFQSTQPSQSIDVSFGVDGVWAGATRAATTHTQANLKFQLTGAHGFSWRIPARYRDDQLHNLDAVAEPLASSGLLRRRLVNIIPFRLPALEGALDSLTNAVLRGWAVFNPDEGYAVTVEFWEPGVGPGGLTMRLLLGAQATNITRTDVNTALGVSGAHGFEFQIPARMQDGRPHSIEVVARHPNGSTKLIGTSQFTIVPVFYPAGP